MPTPPNLDGQTQAVVFDSPPYTFGPIIQTVPVGSTASYHNGTEAANQPLPSEPGSPSPVVMLAARVFTSIGVSVPDSTWTTIGFDTVERQIGQLWSPTSPSVFTFVRQGWFNVVGGVDFAASATGSRGIRFVRSDGIVLAALRVPAPTEVCMLHLDTQDFFLAQQTVHMEVWQSSGGTLTTVAEDRQSPIFSALYQAISV